MMTCSLAMLLEAHSTYLRQVQRIVYNGVQFELCLVNLYAVYKPQQPAGHWCFSLVTRKPQQLWATVSILTQLQVAGSPRSALVRYAAVQGARPLQWHLVQSRPLK